MAIVPRRKRDGSFSFQVKVKDPDGKWYETPTFPTREDAEKAEAELVKLKLKAARALSGDARTTRVAEYWEVWAEDCRTKVSEGWRITQDQMYRDYVAPVIGNVLMKDVTAPLVGKVFKRAEEGWEEHRGVGPQTRLNVYTLIHKMFADAVEYYEMLAANPVKPKFHRPNVPKTEAKFLEPKQALQLLETAAKHVYLGPAVWVETIAALRTEAMIGLEWPAVDWERDQLLIRQAWKAKVGRIEPYPKGKDWEFVPMPPLLKKYLRAEWDRLGKPATGFVCRGIKGGQLSYNTYLRALKRLCETAGVPVVTPHELRHTSTELWVQQGATEEDIRRLLNHASASTTRRYMHRTEERLTALGTNLGNSASFPNGKKEISATPSGEGGILH